MCSLLLGNNKPNPHSRWGNTPQKTENTPEPAPGGPFFEQRPENPGKIAKPRLARRMLARARLLPELLHRERAGRQKSTAVELLLHVAGPGEGRRLLGSTLPEKGRAHKRKNSGGRMIAPPKTKPSRAAHSWRKVRKRAQGVSPPKCEVLNRAQGVPPCSQKAWGDGRSPTALRGRELGGGRKKALSRSGLPGKRQKKKPPGGGLGGQR